MPDDTSAKIAIVIPALNEEDAIRQLLTEIPPNQAEWIIVVDNGSSDHTAQVARSAGVHVISEPQRGYGRACHSGSMAAQELGAEILVFMDGDGSDNPQDIPTMLAPILAGQADLVIGARNSYNAERGAIPVQARLGNWLVSHLISFLYHTHLRDVGSFRVIRTEKLAALHMNEMSFGWPVEMLVKAARAQYRLVELPIHYRCRSHGRSKVAGTISGSVRAAYAMLTITLRYVGTRETHV